MGCDNYIELIKKKITPFLFPQSCVILDGDALNKVNKMNWSKIGTPKNVFCLPGTASPERELAEFLLNEVRDADTFWASVNNDYSRYVCFKDYTIEEIQSDRKKSQGLVPKPIAFMGKIKK